MATKTQQRREDLREQLIDIAEKVIAAEGPSAIKARKLADEAGCAVGAIYNVFGDLQEIVIAVNGRTFKALGEAVAQSLIGAENSSPTERLITMSYAYMEYASQHPESWRALFSLRMSTDMEVPKWYLAELERLFGFIGGPVRECFPDYAPEDVILMTRGLFSSIHGIVLLGLENRISGVPRDQIERMIALLLTNATSIP
ncbi:TetR/AcrR family transcriptional regulator [Planktotalea sp.]|uniref:TetR/AcrR family transcriptional regulator n=1 Tax=Planktotalea sp. TaxID=2029877 RepID=UPI003D6B7301